MCSSDPENTAKIRDEFSGCYTKAPRGTGARAAGEEDEAMSRLALAMGVSRLATISCPAAQEEARVRVLRRAQLLAALKEKTAGILEASLLWEELEAIEQVSVVLPSAPRFSWAWPRS